MVLSENGLPNLVNSKGSNSLSSTLIFIRADVEKTHISGEKLGQSDSSSLCLPTHRERTPIVCVSTSRPGYPIIHSLSFSSFTGTLRIQGNPYSGSEVCFSPQLTEIG